MKFGRILKSCMLVALLSVLLAPQAHAYLDPGTGSYIFQLLLAAAVGLAFVVKVFWSRIKGFFAKLFNKEQPQPEEAPDD